VAAVIAVVVGSAGSQLYPERPELSLHHWHIDRRAACELASGVVGLNSSRRFDAVISRQLARYAPEPGISSVMNGDLRRKQHRLTTQGYRIPPEMEELAILFLKQLSHNNRV